MILRRLLFTSLLYVAALTIPVHQHEMEDTSDHLGELLEDGKRVYTNIWAVELDEDNEKLANEIARDFDLRHNGRIGNMRRVFEFVHEGTNARVKRRAVERTRQLIDHPRIKWAEQQLVLERNKRDYLSDGYLREKIGRASCRERV